MFHRLVMSVLPSMLMVGLLASAADAQAPFSYRRLVDFPATFPASTYVSVDSTLALASDGTLFGTMTHYTGRTDDYGTLFKMTPDGAHTVLHTFLSVSEGLPIGTPIQASDGNIYGVYAPRSGASGGLYKANLNGVYELLHTFGASDGGRPTGRLLEASNGRLYGVASSAVFEITRDGSFRVLQVFNDPFRTGGAPANLVEGPNGDLIGTTAGFPQVGLIVGASVYRLTLSGVMTRLEYVGFPLSLIRARDGNVFGTGIVGGRGEGGIYRIAPDGTASVVARLTTEPFRRTPSVPQVIEGTDGQLYAWSCVEGPGGHGQVMRVGRDGSVSVLRTLTGDTDGGCAAEVFQAANGRLYGLTYFPAVVFAIDQSGFAVIHTFSSGSSRRSAVLTAGADGRLFGTLDTGGASGNGGIYRLSPSEPDTGSSSFPADFDGDGRSDRVVFGTTTGRWSVLLSSTQFDPAAARQYDWGLRGDVPLVADFDGDGKADLVVYRPTEGRWYVRFSSSGYSFSNWTWYEWGLAGDIPLATDFDGDHKTDLVVYRPSDGRWYVRFSSSSYSFTDWTSYQWGLSGDVPLAADFDGDHRTDLSVFRPSNGTWYIRLSSDNYERWTSYQWGLVGDVPLVTDFDGDGQTDLAVWRPSTGNWYVRYSTSQYSYATWRAIGWGLTDDVPVPGDFDGDHRTDATVWRPETGAWFDLYSGSDYSVATYLSFVWGYGTDTPL